MHHQHGSRAPGREKGEIGIRPDANLCVQPKLNETRRDAHTERLPILHGEPCRFIALNLPFVSEVALMGLEITGYTRANLEALWINPSEYQRSLREAVQPLTGARIRTFYL